MSSPKILLFIALPLAFLNIPLFIMLNMPISFVLGRLPTGGMPTTSPH